jgi:hypothetical protein
MKNFWQTLRQEMDELLQQLRSSMECPDDLGAFGFVAFEVAIRDELDEAVITWIWDKRWPKSVEHDMEWVMCLRLSKALRLCMIMSTNEWLQVPGREEALEWMLIETWPVVVGEVASEIQSRRN